MTHQATPSISGGLLGYRRPVTGSILEKKKPTNFLDIHNKVSSTFTEARICLSILTPPVPLQHAFSPSVRHSFLLVLCSLTLSLSCWAKTGVNSCRIYPERNTPTKKPLHLSLKAVLLSLRSVLALKRSQGCPGIKTLISS